MNTQHPEYLVPNELINLYAHWSLHLDSRPSYKNKSKLNQKRIVEISAFAKLRMAAWQNRCNEVYPTSPDPIISKFKFCNIYRELDRQTIYFHRRLKHLEGDFESWLLNMFASRMIANIDTVNMLGLLTINVKNTAAKKILTELPRPKYGNAYVFPISTIQSSPWPTREQFICEYLPFSIGEVAAIIKSGKNRAVNQLLELILPQFKFNHRFLWTEVLIDIHYQFPSLVNLDRNFHIGPGAIPSIKYLSAGTLITPDETLNILAAQHSMVDGANLSYKSSPVAFTAENWEGICCEFRKYQNLQKGTGRIRLYKQKE